MDSEAGADPEGRLADFREEEERCVYRSGSEETVDCGGGQLGQEAGEQGSGD